MRIAALLIVCITILLVISPVQTSSQSSEDDVIAFWNDEWSYRQELILPIKTNDSHAAYQPIDIQITFDNRCWTENETKTSIRICCWHEMQWHELDSQIYDLSYTQTNYIEKCNLVFLVPNWADGTEKYYIYYDDTEKITPKYTDHVTVEDSYYFSSPISDITAEAKYYGITEDGYSIYGVGQEGKLLDRSFSNIVVKQKKNTEKFDLLQADQIVSFAFSYYFGDDESDECSSDQSFVHKEVFVDGNLMVEFGIISESNNKNIRTTAIYKYYYSPLDEKRINVRVKHEITEDVIVKGKENIDGRFGVMFSFKSRNPSIKKMNFGDIFPYLRFYSENDNIEKHQLDTNPDSKQREWILSFEDDADLGKEAWIAYGDDDTGRTNSVIFSSHKDIITSGEDENDGIQLKISEKEYFNFLGTRIGYASINFGRNSYEKGHGHDLDIPDDLVVEFDAELFSTEDGGYQMIRKEAEIYQDLVKLRNPTQDSSFEQEQKKYRLEVFTYLGGTRFSYPFLAERTNLNFPIMWVELCQDGTIVASGIANRSFFPRGRAHLLFPKVVEGDYLIKVYWMIDNSTKFFRGARAVSVEEHTKVHVICTWERAIHLWFSDQNGETINGIQTILVNEDDVIFDQNITNSEGKVILKAPYNPEKPYYLKAYYRNILVYEGEIQNKLRNVIVDLDIELYDLTVEIKDLFHLPPGVELSPMLLGSEPDNSLEIKAEECEPGIFVFEDIPKGRYKLQVIYGSFIDEHYLEIPLENNYLPLDFSASFDVSLHLFDLQGNSLHFEKILFEIERNGQQVFESDETSFTLPPGQYTIRVYADGEFVGSKDVEITNDKNVNIITTVPSVIPGFVSCLALFLCGILVVLTLIKKLDFSSFLKLIAILIIIIALVQPWWFFSGSSTSPMVERKTEIFVYPQVMIESTSFQGKNTFDISEIPDVFIDVLEKIMYGVYAICILLGISFFFKKFGKQTYSMWLDGICFVVLIVLLSVFYIATEKLCEVSIGRIQGSGIIDISLGTQAVALQSSWGLTIGFYAILLSILLLMIPFFISVKNYFCQFKKKK